MSVDLRIGTAGKETFVGTIEINGKTKKCKVVFKNGALYRAVAGGVRLKYFDVNDRREKVNVPAELFDAAKKFGVEHPKLDGIKVNKSRSSGR